MLDDKIMENNLHMLASVYLHAWVTGSVSVTAVQGSALESRLGQVVDE